MNQAGRSVQGQHTTRKLTIIAQDPGFRKTRTGGGEIVTTQAEVPAEELLPGPTGYRVKVIDYDVSTDTLYVPAELGSDGDCYKLPSDQQLLTDPRFHAQNVYAIVMRTLARFEKALGRRVAWGSDGQQLHVVRMPSPSPMPSIRAPTGRSSSAISGGATEIRSTAACRTM